MVVQNHISQAAQASRFHQPNGSSSSSASSSLLKQQRSHVDDLLFPSQDRHSPEQKGPKPTDVVYLKLRGTRFRVPSEILGLLPDSMLLSLFPTGLIAFYPGPSEELLNRKGSRINAAKVGHHPDCRHYHSPSGTSIADPQGSIVESAKVVPYTVIHISAKRGSSGYVDAAVEDSMEESDLDSVSLSSDDVDDDYAPSRQRRTVNGLALSNSGANVEDCECRHCDAADSPEVTFSLDDEEQDAVVRSSS
ncbi:hypothetical protein BC829DRAFT_238828 [Chytridium lagenaria]|nr:hypothetical protein BC829DRAFT_238828 [Chytridium lagenaria]